MLAGQPEKTHRAVYQRQTGKKLHEGQVLSDRQYGFRKGRSTIGAVKRVMARVTESDSVWGV